MDLSLNGTLEVPLALSNHLPFFLNFSIMENLMFYIRS